MNWLITDKGDQDARLLADRHYSRRTPGSPQFCRNGQNLVFIADAADAVWVTFRPTPGKAIRQDGFDAWECSLFRNEGTSLSSQLIREAVRLTWALWGPAPSGGLITYVRPECVASGLPGYCFLRAGWRHVGASADGKPMFRAPRLSHVPDWRLWSWKPGRGGVLRKRFEALR